MAIDSDKRWENEPLTQFRRKVNGTRWFLNKFFGPVWLQRPTKTDLIISLVFWIIGLAAALYVKLTLTNEEAERNAFLLNAFMIGSTFSLLGMYISYLRGNKKSAKKGNAFSVE